MKERPTTIVVPAYNEAARLDIEAFEGALVAVPGLRFLFVDDGSRDATRAVLEAFAGRRTGSVEVLILGENQGKAEAVRRGLLRACETESDLVGYLDADLSAPLEAVVALRQELIAHPEVWCAIGSRVRLLGRRIERSPVRHYLGRVFATAASMTLDLPVYDTQCGCKLFCNIPPVRAALEEPFRSRWIFDVELLARLAQSAGGDPASRFREVPLERWHARSGSRLTLRDWFRAPTELLAIRRRYRRIQ